MAKQDTQQDDQDTMHAIDPYSNPADAELLWSIYDDDHDPDEEMGPSIDQMPNLEILASMLPGVIRMVRNSGMTGAPLQNALQQIARARARLNEAGMLRDDDESETYLAELTNPDDDGT